MNGNGDIDKNMFSHPGKSIVIGVVFEVTLAKDQFRVDIRKYSLSHRAINEWSKLSTDCVNESSVNIFKIKVDTYLRRAGYTKMKLHCPRAIWAFVLDGNLVKSCYIMTVATG